VKNRELRRKVLVSARMRVGSAWSDASILNISSRGMLVGSREAPARGTYLEIRRGSNMIVARVIWSRLDRFGVQTQDRLSTEELVSGAAPSNRDRGEFVERRTQARLPSAEAARWRGNSLQFAWITLVVAAMAIFGAMLVREYLALPLASVQLAIGKG
jgi:hypothetical protein